MRFPVVALGVALAIGAFAYGSSRSLIARTAEPAPRTVQPTPKSAESVPIAAIVAVTPVPEAPLAEPRAAAPRPQRVISARSIAAHVKAAAARYGLPESLVAAVVSVESEFNPRAVSRRGALGLMQLMPSTAALLGVRDAFDPEQNVDGGARYLRDLMDRFDNDVSLALAAYNAGAQPVIRYGGVPPYPETRAFVARVLARVGRVTMPAVARAAPSAPAPSAPSTPRIRFARLTDDRVRRDDTVFVSLDTSVASVDPAPPHPAVSTPAEKPAVSVSAMTRVESP